jgi:hypothetical protein
MSVLPNGSGSWAGSLIPGILQMLVSVFSFELG